MEKIYCSYADTEVAELVTIMKCPYCNEENREYGMDLPGETYIVTCEECEKEFSMYFDVD